MNNLHSLNSYAHSNGRGARKSRWRYAQQMLSVFRSKHATFFSTHLDLEKT